MRFLPTNTFGFYAASEVIPRALDWHDWDELTRIRHEPTRNRKIAVRAVLRFALSHTVDGHVSPSAWRFARSADGRPFVAVGMPKVHFSVSHTDGLSVIAVSRSFPVGIDTEVEQISDDTRFIRSFLSPRELMALASIEPEERAAVLLKLWTLKEAYVKLVGVGVGADFRHLEFGLDPPHLMYDRGATLESVATRFRTWRLPGPRGACHVALAIGHPHVSVQN
jgi:4'-phosphopantetheinyl transferase